MMTYFTYLARNARQSHWAIRIAGMLFLLALATPVSVANAESVCTSAPEQCVSYFFREYWQANDGLRTFGRAIGGSEIHYLPGNTTYYTQTFERTVLEYFPGKSGTSKYGRAAVGQLWHDTFRSQLTPVTDAATFPYGSESCQEVASQRPVVCGAFLDYYRTNGLHFDAIPYVTQSEQRNLFGLPVTPVMRWNKDGQTRLVQVFTHARLDYTVDATGAATVTLGDVVVDLLNAKVPLPTTPSAPINYLYGYNGAILDNKTLDTYRTAMPKSGYWQASADSVYVATSSFAYLDYFYTVWAGNGQKYVALTLLIKNDREAPRAPVYLDYSYISVIDTDGKRYSPSTLTKYLTTPFGPTTVNPGTSVAGQLVFVVPTNAAPAQIEIQLANLDQYTSRFVQVIELRVPAQQ
jgi:hypothetical protein